MFSKKNAFILLSLLILSIAGYYLYINNQPPAPIADENGRIYSDPGNMIRSPHFVPLDIDPK